MAEKRKWKGIQLNEVRVQGEVVSDPVFNGEYAFMDLETVVTQQDQNGQFVDIPQIIPLMVEPGSPNIRVVREYIRAGRKLHVDGQFKSWDAGGQKNFAVKVNRIKLGDKPYEPNPEAAVPMPPS